MRRRCLVLLAVIVTAIALGIPMTPVGAAVGGDQTTTTTEAPPTPNIIPRPNQGAEPTEAGDRGGALQTGLFVLIMGSVGVIGLLVWRESRKARATRGF